MNHFYKLGYAALFSLAFLTACNSSSPSSGKTDSNKCVSAKDLEASGIIDGTKVTPNDRLAKRVVMLLQVGASKDVSICTGTPIAKDVILTAAHCVKDIKKIKVIFHTDITCESGFNVDKQGIDAVDFVYHEEYTHGYSDIRNDIALVKLKSTIPADYQISKIYDGKTPVSSDRVTLIGYGKMDEKKGGSGFLRTSQRSFKTDIQLNSDKTAIQISQESGGICQGDSGGPVFYDVNGELQVAGVNSYVSGARWAPEAICHNIGVSTYAPAFKSWIQSQGVNLR